MNVTDEKGKQGTWKFYSGYRILVFEITYKNDIRHGPCSKYYFSNGIIREESNYYYGKKDGEYKSYFADGQLHTEGAFKDGRKSDEWIIYYKSSAEKKCEGTYVNGRKEGIWVFYDNKGVKTVQGKYRMDVKEGDWETYDSDGKIIEVKKYINGVLQLKEGVQKTTTTSKKTNKPAGKTVTKPTGLGTDTTKTNPNNQVPLKKDLKDEKKPEDLPEN